MSFTIVIVVAVLLLGVVLATQGRWRHSTGGITRRPPAPGGGDVAPNDDEGDHASFSRITEDGGTR